MQAFIHSSNTYLHIYMQAFIHSLNTCLRVYMQAYIHSLNTYLRIYASIHAFIEYILDNNTDIYAHVMNELLIISSMPSHGYIF